MASPRRGGGNGAAFSLAKHYERAAIVRGLEHGKGVPQEQDMPRHRR